ncbi:choline BCCT transporter BetT [Paeniglutamicibacter psychrophenolicus]|uniref:Choline/glycine/proline betaine transport protein n=1 Tax=Paeniglutamicibacter psychrophenolicus TaxID=257454 RepID=A0ABS4W9H1_9MICC|nr:choline BCCT transporter BetT [Paeniglutamicibacter psychrophenolicus]MBP2372861.1 choline/glycine/proline betaine transport protein [Paeniglutamicibacter psychrophenolicus]
MAGPEDMQGTEREHPQPMVERSRFGVSERRKDPAAEENRAPITSTELSKGPAELIEYAGPKVNWRVFIISAVIILAFSLWAIVVPDNAATAMAAAVAWISTNLGWFYVVTVTLVVLFVLWVAFSKEGSVRLGPDHSRPQYNLFTWVAMLFAAGVGIDMLFYSVTGPITQYITPPSVDPESAAAAQDAVVWTMFHYGVAGWSMYALLGMAMGYFAYRWGMPLSIRAALYPLLGKRVRGATGDVIDIFALVGTVFGVATSMGIGVVLLNVGISWLFGIPEGLALQIALVLVAVIMTIASCTSGVDKGIRLVSELNLWSAAAMMLYILITGKTSFLLTAMVENIGRFIFTLPERTLQTFAYEEDGSAWMAGWTLFFWAFWLAWGPFVGMFLARISRGRTLREFVIAAITAPVLCDFFIVSIFGNSAMSEVLGGNTEFAELAIRSPEHGWYALLEMFPGAPFLIGLATLSGLLFYLTSANSGAMVMSNFSSSIPDPSQDGAKWLRIFWALLTAVLTVAMLVAGGVTTMEHATLIFALPVTIIAYLVMASFSKVLRMERAEREGTVMRRRSVAAHGGNAPEKTWRQRMAQLRAYPSNKAVAQYVERTIQPALEEVAGEFNELGYEAELSTVPNEQTGIAEHTLLVHMHDHRNFHYQVAAVEAPVPAFGARTVSREVDVYFRLEVFTQTGTEGYDLMGLDKAQVINDVLDRYEAHLSFLQYSSEHDYASLLTPPRPATGMVPQVDLPEPDEDEGKGRE